MSQDANLLLTLLSVVISLGTIIVAILKGRDMVTRAALDAVGSLEGRAIVMAISNEKHDRIEEKLDTIEEKLDVLASSVTSMTVRLAVIEDQRSNRREEN